ncbi:MAG TPA: LamG domain-containing protein [Candidatus Margulisiibacteriota bacterium]|nr:LamG domain-containing protein [Candidatus Margulisiibacteriota bacterium]
MERSWVYLVVGAAALAAVVFGIKHLSSSEAGLDAEKPREHQQQLAGLPDMGRPQGSGWIARQGGPNEPTSSGSSRTGSTAPRGASAGGVRDSAGPGGAPSNRGGASVLVDRTRGGTGESRAGVGAVARAGGDAIQMNANVPVADVPFQGARPITGPIGGAGGRSGQAPSHDTVQQVTDKPADTSKPVPDDGGPVLSLPFDKTTAPDRGDAAVVEQGVTFDSGQGAVFSTNSQFVVPDGGNLKGEGGSISMWVQPGWAGGDDSNASLAGLRNLNQWEDRLQIFKNGVYMRFLMADSAGQESNIGQNISDWQPGDWHQVVATWGQNDNGQLMQSFYIDGKMVGQVPVQGQFNVRPGTPLYVGSDLPQGVPGTNGAISQFQAYNRALAPDEVANLAANRPK